MIGSPGVSVSAFVSRALATASLVALAGAGSATTLQDLPKGARPGDCFSHNSAAAVYRTDRVPVPQPPLESWRDIPAAYKSVSRQVLVAPARVDHETVPAVMGARIHWIEHPGPDRIVETPPVYRWIEKRVLVSPARLVWRPGVAESGYGGGDGAAVSVRPTGEVMCRVLIPARYEVRRVRVLVAAGRTCVVKGPSSRERVVETYVVRPARTVDHPVAAVYRTVTDRVLVSPARRERITTPQPPRYIDRRVLVTPARTRWTHMACVAPSVRPMGYGAEDVRSRAAQLDGAPQSAPIYHAPPASYGAPDR